MEHQKQTLQSLCIACNASSPTSSTFCVTRYCNCPHHRSAGGFMPKATTVYWLSFVTIHPIDAIQGSNAASRQEIQNKNPVTPRGRIRLDDEPDVREVCNGLPPPCLRSTLCSCPPLKRPLHLILPRC